MSAAIRGPGYPLDNQALDFYLAFLMSLHLIHFAK
jgi:hypothetical protein